LIVKHPVRPEYADDWSSLIEEFTVATRAEPGNIFFDWFRGVEDCNVYVLVEAFHDGAAGRAHVSSAHFQAAIAQLPKWLSDVPEIVNVEARVRIGHAWQRYKSKWTARPPTEIPVHDVSIRHLSRAAQRHRTNTVRNPDTE
jgi:quinol monooxygenase YgiN